MKVTVERIPYSFVRKDMKRTVDGSGEAKLFVKCVSEDEEQRLDAFFGIGTELRCSISQSNILDYLKQVRLEYIYHNFSDYINANDEVWRQKYAEIAAMSAQKFSIKLSKTKSRNRYYIRCYEPDNIFSEQIRNLLVPQISNIVFLKDVEKNTLEMSLEINTNYHADNEMTKDAIDTVERQHCDLPLNRILFGAPGTGKSFMLGQDQKRYFPAEKNFERVTFHPAYAYAQFFGSYKPVSEDGNILYRFVPGPFLRVLLKALAKKDEDFLLLIEEINRADVAAVFGDVFQLLDRDYDGTSEYEIDMPEDFRRYIDDDELHADFAGLEPDDWDEIRKATSDKKLGLPTNCYIWATMNSADQGVMPLDTAFKRRWNFEYIGINESEENADFRIEAEKDEAGKIVKPEINWHNIRHLINDNLSKIADVAEDRWLGPFFLKEKDFKDRETFNKVFKSKVLMYLYQDVARYAGHGVLFVEDYVSYSKLCEAFDDKGMAVFAGYQGEA